VSLSPFYRDILPRNLSMSDLLDIDCAAEKDRYSLVTAMIPHY
jgi:hypothetical protein